jgi:hypothetical protein
MSKPYAIGMVRFIVSRVEVQLKPSSLISEAVLRFDWQCRMALPRCPTWIVTPSAHSRPLVLRSDANHDRSHSFDRSSRDHV